MGHGTIRIGRQRLFEAGHRLLVVVAEAPVEATVEPTLRIRGGGGHLPRIRTEIVRIVHVASSLIFFGADAKASAAPACYGWSGRGRLSARAPGVIRAISKYPRLAAAEPRYRRPCSACSGASLACLRRSAATSHAGCGHPSRCRSALRPFPGRAQPV